MDSVDVAEIPAGLLAFESSDFDQAWIRPGFEASAFEAVLIEPAVIEFDPNWGRSDGRTGSRLSKTQADLDGTREEMVDVIDTAVRQAVERDERFRIVEQPGPGVLRMQPRVDALYISAIDPMKVAARTDQYVRSVGHGRPGMQLLDSVSGEVLMQLSDARETRRYPDLQLANPGLVANDFIAWYQRFTEDLLDQMP